MSATRRLPAVFLLGMIALSGTVLVFHDYICRDHGCDLHEICGPLHTAFVSAGPFAAEESLGALPQRALCPLAEGESVLAGFRESIFHPPDISV
jgi:hypothetical protein